MRVGRLGKRNLDEGRRDNYSLPRMRVNIFLHINC